MRERNQRDSWVAQERNPGSLRDTCDEPWVLDGGFNAVAGPFFSSPGSAQELAGFWMSMDKKEHTRQIPGIHTSSGSMLRERA